MFLQVNNTVLINLDYVANIRVVDFTTRRNDYWVIELVSNTGLSSQLGRYPSEEAAVEDMRKLIAKLDNVNSIISF